MKQSFTVADLRLKSPPSKAFINSARVRATNQHNIVHSELYAKIKEKYEKLTPLASTRCS